MTRKQSWKPDPKLDLVLERDIDVSPELVWLAWTRPEHLKPWFCPKPWSVSECEIDLRPGGAFRTVMNGPNGESHASGGCYLEVVPNERLVWTDALLPGYRPALEPFFTGVLLLEKRGKLTHYTAIAIHRDEGACKKHAEMGFHHGWGIALDQLVAHVKVLKGER
jgi:uncharacterized protein YndB with AHSA1/START domain